MGQIWSLRFRDGISLLEKFDFHGNAFSCLKEQKKCFNPWTRRRYKDSIICYNILHSLFKQNIILDVFIAWFLLLKRFIKRTMINFQVNVFANKSFINVVSVHRFFWLSCTCHSQQERSRNINKSLKECERFLM